MITRVRRTRSFDLLGETVTSPMGRVGRTPRAAVHESKAPIVAGRVTRMVPHSPKDSTPPVFVIDWSRSLSWKFSIFMVSSCMYYFMNRSVIADADYDRLARELLAGYSTFTHIHKRYVTREMLRAGTAYSVRQYPLMVQQAAFSMLSNYRQC